MTFKILHCFAPALFRAVARFAPKTIRPAVALGCGTVASASAAIVDVFTDKARYNPGDTATIEVVLRREETPPRPLELNVSFWHLGRQHGPALRVPVPAAGVDHNPVSIPWRTPDADFTGYFVDVRLVDGAGAEFGRGETAVDVSSDWKRFPRYGFLAHYAAADGADPDRWIAELNKFHLNGLQYYDFQYRHERPLAGSVASPAGTWREIAGRPVEARVVHGFIAAARRHNIVSMAYNASYSAYEDAIADASPVKLEWATWDDATAPRTRETVKSFGLPSGGGWQTSKLFYMNQNSGDWQRYLFGQMKELFAVYPFDGWHIDTFGAERAYAYDGTPVDYIAGFGDFVNRANKSLGKPVVFNAVNTMGQELLARSAAEFVYSELWTGHETFHDLLTTAERVRKVNPSVGIVFAAYTHRGYEEPGSGPKELFFNTPSVLLTNAAIFASGAAHIELGDDARLLCSEYFPSRRFKVSAELRTRLRRYYDFLTAYENVLRDGASTIPLEVEIEGQPVSRDAWPDTIWTLARGKPGLTALHLINLRGSDSAEWRDIEADRPDAPSLDALKVRVFTEEVLAGVRWASPDFDGGRMAVLPIRRGTQNGRAYVEVVLPSLKYWSMLVLEHGSSAGKGGQ
ncbi:MAG TPA: glycoside hydrolase family 66 protein [Opitutaceae bacterium]